MAIFDNPFDPQCDTALVTGAGNGIGSAIAQALVREGVRTVFADLSEDRVSASVTVSGCPDLAFPWVGDLAIRAGCDALLAYSRAKLGKITHFVHSASPPRREADHALAVLDETWEQMRAVNVDAGFHLAREIARELIAAQAQGSILMLTSLHADPTLTRHIPLGRLGRSDDLAPMALAVLSNRISGYVTGAAFVVDGGLSLTNWFEAPTLDDL
jgi:3-oxoacyl-[acyl-carrier protein] reductase